MEVRNRTNGEPSNGQPPTQQHQQQRHQPPVVSPTNPICRCRVMYLGSSVPHITKDGLQGIQEPLRELYPVDQDTLNSSSNIGIDSWLSIWSNGILIENIDETGREVKRFFKIEALHYCAAVKYVDPMSHHQQQPNMYSNNNMMPNVNLANLPRFLPLDSPHSRQSNPNPPVFASIIRRTTGIKVLECHAFICKREAAANALVRCCFHAYADTMYAKQLCSNTNSPSTFDMNNNVQRQSLDINVPPHQQDSKQNQESTLAQRKSKSIANLTQVDNYNKPNEQREINSLARRKSTNEHPFLDNHDYPDRTGIYGLPLNGELKKQSKFSKSLHQLDQQNYPGNLVYNQLNNHQDHMNFNQSTSTSCINLPNGRWQRAQQQQQMLHQQQVPPTIPFHTPYTARIPSYPPQAMLNDPNTASHGGTLRSIKSMAANSIASTLLRNKKQSKANSMAKLNQDKIISFHQPMMMNSATLGKPIMMPPVPAMFLPNLPAAAHHMMNGSQTMRPPSGRPMMPVLAPQINFEAMTPKEMKKLLKKSAKYGLDQNEVPMLPVKPPLLHMQPLPPPPPPPLPSNCQVPQPTTRSGTMISQPGGYSDLYSDMSQSSIRMQPQMMMGLSNPTDPNVQMKPLLVKPNPEFLKSKSGKKWLKQQKEFKKLLPPHLEGLPIIFGPPPMNALEPAGLPSAVNGLPMPPAATVPTNAPPFMPVPPPHPGLPVLDSSGYYNPHPFYGQNSGCGRASAASTLLRYSPHSQTIQDAANGGFMGSMYNNNADCWQGKNHQVMMRNGVQPLNPSNSVLRDYSDDSSSVAMEQHNEYAMDPRTRSFLMEGNGMRRKQQNHMVEQSVISLGDEHDFDDEDDQGDEETDCDQVDRGGHNDTYTVSSHHDQRQEMVINGQARSRSMQQVEKQVKTRNHNESTSDQLDNDAYSQPTSSDRSIQQNDDQGSYSSGIYRRGHLNERAFSYSIRQEHKSNGTTANNSDAEYSARNEIHSNIHVNQNDNHQHQHHHHQQQHHLDHQESHNSKQYQQHQQQPNGGNIYQANKRDKNVEYYRDNNDTRSIPVNELTARLENQLNMRSFANARIKSHI